jgi:hypothetical protein
LVCYVTRWLAGFSVLLPLRWWLDCYSLDQRQSLFVLDCSGSEITFDVKSSLFKKCQCLD